MTHNDLTIWGFDAHWLALYEKAGVAPDCRGRVVGEQRGAFAVMTELGSVLAVPSGALRHTITARQAERPAVGDWVALRAPVPGASRQQMEMVLPRRTHISRKAAGRAMLEQTLAANVDTAFVVCAFGGDINARKIERFMAIAREGGATPVVLLNKQDLAKPGEADEVIALAAGAAVYSISGRSGAGVDALSVYLQPGRTVTLIGSSGAGKTTLLNRWLGDDVYSTGEVRADGRGKHTTRTRNLVSTPSGTLVIDTPGLREVGVWAADRGIAEAFNDLVQLAEGCRFNDCTHVSEGDCAVRAAVAAGTLEPARLTAWLHLRAEAQGQAAVQRRWSRKPKRAR